MTKKVLKMYHLTPTQEGMLFYSILNKGSRNYVEQVCFELTGEINFPLLTDAWQKVCQRHEVLRTDFVWKQIKTPVQVILNEKPVEIIFENLSSLSVVEQSKVIAEIRERELDSLCMEENRLNRVVFLKLQSGKAMMCWTCHHILIDGWSVSVILKDFLNIYYYLLRDLPSPAEPVVQFSDYLEWLKRQNKSKALQFWKEYLASLTEPTLLPGDRVDRRFDVVTELQIIHGCLDEVTTKSLNEFCRKQNVTLNALIQAAWGIVLQRYNNTNVSCSGMTGSGRTLEVKHVEEIVGVLINTVPVIVETQLEDTVQELLARVNTQLVDIRDYGYLPLPEIQAVSLVKSGHKFFDALVVVENHPANSINLGNEILNLRFDSSFELTNYDLALTVKNLECFQATFSYNADLFTSELMERVKENFLQTIREILNNPTQLAQNLCILSHTEKRLIFETFNDSDYDYDDTQVAHEVFEAQVKATPDQLAIVYAGQQLTYQELNARANQLAHTLRARGLKREQVVAICAERSIEMVIATLAVFKAGGAYLPIDPNLPEARIAFMLEDSGAYMLLTQSYLMDRFCSYQGEILNLHDQSTYASVSTNLVNVNTPDDPLYVIYTSGSTGKPKGVVIEHRGLVNMQNLSAKSFQITPADRLTQFANFSFDASVWEMFPIGLFNGVTLYLVPQEVINNYSAFTRFLNEMQITVAFLPPAYASQLKAEEVESLRLLITGGAMTNHELVNRWRKRLLYINAYGPTEATISATHWISTDEDVAQCIPIGKPNPNTKVYILGANNQPVPIGAVGEICLSGVGVARGYLNRPELTAEKFVPNPFIPETRMYRTGDLGLWLPDGNIQFIGRSDHQVKVRGYRMELGEIETKLQNLQAVKDAVVIAREDENGEKYLFAYYISDEELTTQLFREILAKELPEYMIPSYFIRMEAFPLTPSGKVDIKKLPVHEGIVEDSTKFVAPTNPIEEKLVQIWEESFKKKKISIIDDFYALGGHSLKAIQIAANIYKEMNIEVSLRTIFAAPTIKELARAISGVSKNLYAEIPVAAKAELYPVSSAQKRLYAVRQLSGETITYNIPLIWRIEGTLNRERLKNALQELVARHESLRTSFIIDNGVVMQKVHQEVEFNVDEFIVQANEVEDFLHNYIQPFDLGQAPLMRAALLQLIDSDQSLSATITQHHMLVLNLHHIIADGVSMNHFCQELANLYEGNTLPPLRLQYKDYAIWQNQLFASDALKEQEKYWLQRFAGEIPVLNLPTDYSRPTVMSYAGDSHYFTLERELVQGLEKLAREQGGTLYMVILALINLLLARYTGQEDILIGSPIAGRPHPDLEPIMGMFVNTLIQRNAPEGTKTFKAFLAEVKENALKAYENQDYQIEMLIEQLHLTPDLSRNPLFQVMYTLHRGIELTIPVKEVQFIHERYNFHRTKFDITFNVTETDQGLLFDLEYCTHLFTSTTMQPMGEHFKNIVRTVVNNSEIQLDSIEITTAAEKELILHTFNATAVPYPKEKTIVELFQAQVERTPEKVAVVYEGRGLTYRELNERANQLAHNLWAKGLKREEVVGIIAERSLEMVIGVLAIIKAGGAYLPLNTDFPVSRMEYMLKDAEANVCLLGSGFGEIELIRQVVHEVIDLTDEANYSEKLSNLPQLNTADDLIYVIYTSGSTGLPKGVMIEHYNVNRLISNSNMLQISENERILQTGSLAFDASTFEIWGTLLNGACLYLVNKADLLSATSFETKMKEYGITMIFITVALFNQLIEENPQIFSGLKTLFVGGEVLSPKHMNLVRNLFPDINVNSCYGPTESTTFTTFFPLTQDYQHNIPIGRPVSNSRVYILSPTNQLQPVGVPGELCIAGDGLARGYLKQPELTKEKFIDNPFEASGKLYRTGDLARWLPDGNLDFIGRIDHQVKIRGFRIELGEIESQLLQHEAIKEAVVIVYTAKGCKELAAYFVSDVELSLLDLRHFLTRVLPDYMIPTHFMRLEKLPLTSNGKIDRKALPEPDDKISTGQEYVAPRNIIEQRLVELWSEILGREQIGINDSFFDLGGNSIKLITLTNLLNQEFKVEIKTVDLFHYTTINQIATSLIAEEQEEEIIEYEL